MKFYMAAKFSRREELEALAPLLAKAGHECYARWVFGGEDGLSREDIASLDYDDVNGADGIICFTHPRGSLQPGGGRHVEFGIAAGLGKRLVIIGPRENIFHHLPGVEQYDSLTDFILNETTSNESDGYQNL